MFKLIPIAAITMVLAMLYEYYSVYDHECFKYEYKNTSFYVMIVILLVCFSGLRLTYNDTATYVTGYDSLVVSDNMFSNINWTLGENPGFQVVNLILKAFGASSQSFLMFYSVVTVGLYLWFIRKYSDNFFMSLFVFLAGGVYLFSFAAIKQSVAVAIALLGVDKAIERKWGTFVIWIFIAATFHTYALMFLIIPFIMFKPWTKRTYLLLSGGLIFGVAFQLLLGRVLTLASLLGENYDETVLVGEGVNFFRLAVVCAPIALSFLARKQIREYADDAENLILNLSMLNAVLMFVARFGTAFYLTRLANYFAIFQVITIPYLLKYFNLYSTKIVKIIIYIGFLGFAFYAYGINRAFDSMYTSISVFEYLKSLF